MDTPSRLLSGVTSDHCISFGHASYVRLSADVGVVNPNTPLALTPLVSNDCDTTGVIPVCCVTRLGAICIRERGRAAWVIAGRVRQGRAERHVRERNTNDASRWSSRSHTHDRLSIVQGQRDASSSCPRKKGRDDPPTGAFNHRRWWIWVSMLFLLSRCVFGLLYRLCFHLRTLLAFEVDLHETFKAHLYIIYIFCFRYVEQRGINFRAPWRVSLS